MRVKLGNRELVVAIRKVSDKPAKPVRRHDIPVEFRCHKCKEVISTELENIYETAIGHRYAADCHNCTSLHNGSECATANMILITKEIFENGQPSRFAPDHNRVKIR